MAESDGSTPSLSTVGAISALPPRPRTRRESLKATSLVDALYEAVRTERPGFERRFVFMTGGAFTSKSAKHLASVPNPCVGKPFDGDELLRAIGEVLSKRVSAGADELRG